MWCTFFLSNKLRLLKDWKRLQKINITILLQLHYKYMKPLDFSTKKDKIIKEKCISKIYLQKNTFFAKITRKNQYVFYKKVKNNNVFF